MRLVPTLLGVLVLASASFLVSQGLENSVVFGRGLVPPDPGPDGFVISADDPRPWWPLSAVMMWPAGVRASSGKSRAMATLRVDSDLIQVVLQVTHVVGCDELQRHIAVRRMPHVRQSRVVE